MSFAWAAHTNECAIVSHVIFQSESDRVISGQNHPLGSESLQIPGDYITVLFRHFWQSTCINKTR